jgi:hypothetical protein
MYEKRKRKSAAQTALNDIVASKLPSPIGRPARLRAYLIVERGVSAILERYPGFQSARLQLLSNCREKASQPMKEGLDPFRLGFSMLGGFRQHLCAESMR